MSAEATALKLVQQPSLRESLFAKSDGYRLYQGDSLALLEQFEPGTFDMVFADPPYFLSNGGFTCKNGKRAAVNKGGWDVSRGVDEDHAFTTAWLKACQRVLKPTGTIWVSGTQHVIFSVGFAMQKLGYKLLNTVTWYKPNASPNLACRYFTHSSELLIWASPKPAAKLQHTFNYSKMKADNGGKQMRDVWALPRTGDEELAADESGRVWTMTAPRREEKAHGSHPTQKPVSLLERVIEASTPEDALVLDPFNGSGTTGVAAMKLGRRYVGIDMDEQYLKLSQKRLAEAERAARR
ncbi:site-specific DNA-methyltransferase (adenine-specific) [Archangium gephyra]|uniref:Methyltransferase n=1 Tax=Archangium gephyra TaxID=48 RepID=A0AAC8Q7K7_9BACT|nr:site-specific DNA-methyltransferase [Archangium gephyra]AKJ02016.1 DNA modification methyltransferase [Archangium gephyra]REG34820.1 site-specific DNA-methyltransferase (adenine-specific) [Archangium gephyra]